MYHDILYKRVLSQVIHIENTQITHQKKKITSDYFDITLYK